MAVLRAVARRGPYSDITWWIRELISREGNRLFSVPRWVQGNRSVITGSKHVCFKVADWSSRLRFRPSIVCISICLRNWESWCWKICESWPLVFAISRSCRSLATFSFNDFLESSANGPRGNENHRYDNIEVHVNTCIICGGISIWISQDDLLAQSFLYPAIRCTTRVHFPFYRLTLRAIGRSFFYGAHIDRSMRTKREDHFFKISLCQNTLEKRSINMLTWKSLKVPVSWYRIFPRNPRNSMLLHPPCPR